VRNEYSKNLSQIGGRWAISLRAGIAIFPIFVLSIPILEANLGNIQDFLEWTWVSLLASIPAGLFLYLAHLTYFRNRVLHPKPPISVFFLGLFVGAIKGFLVEVLALSFGLTHGHVANQIAVRTLNSAALSAITIPLIALTLVTAQKFKIQKKELLDQLAFVLSKNAQISTLNAIGEEVSPEQLSQQINKLLGQAKQKFANERAKAQPDYSKLVNILKSTSEDVIRPLSHTLYAKSLLNIPTMSKLQTFKALSIHFQIEIPIIVTAYILFSFKNNFIMYGFGGSLFWISWRALLLMAVLWVFRTIFSPLKTITSYPFITASFLGVFTFVFMDSVLSRTLGYTGDVAKTLLSVVWNLVIVLTSGLLVAMTDVNRFQLESLKLEIDKSEVEAHSKALEQRYLYRSHSKILHGVYHSRLIACAVAIDTVAKSSNPDQLQEELARAESLFEIDFENHIARLKSDYKTIFGELADNWSGVIDIDFEYGNLEGLSAFQILAMNEFLTEALVNAFRHGRATHAHAKFNLDIQQNLHISLTDDGVGYIPSHPGLGSAIFDELSNSLWQIRSRTDSQGAIVTIVIQPEEFK
jgi:hypothetical protein